MSKLTQSMETVSYGGWNNARLSVGNIEIFVTLDVGPRIIRLGTVGGPNELVEYPNDLGKKGGEEYHSYGGHRLWVSPEIPEITQDPDNQPVEVVNEGEWTSFVSPLTRVRIEKRIKIKADQENGRFLLQHTITNRRDEPIECAPWCLTVMAPGGTGYFPQPEYLAPSQKLLPARPLVLWHYTNMRDPRWTWGNRMAALRHDPSMGPIKVGAAIEQGYAAYANNGNLFLKRFGYDPNERYPDFGCNFETYTRENMLEVESLGPLRLIEPGASIQHNEAWYLIENIQLPQDIDEIASVIEELARSRPLL